MSHGEVLTKLTIWLSLGSYAIAAATVILSKHRARSLLGARWIWTLGCALLVAHIFCAFHYYHHWSHTAAYLDTARQTREVTGWDWGGGLFVNYVFAAAWVGDVLWWWIAPLSHEHRRRLIAMVWHGFFVFIVFNATVVFAPGPTRWLGAAICFGLGTLYYVARQRR